jgi:hypothetical protein
MQCHGLIAACCERLLCCCRREQVPRAVSLIFLPCRASSLVLPDLAVTRLPEFKSIAVTAHLWLPLQEVPGPLRTAAQ